MAILLDEVSRQPIADGGCIRGPLLRFESADRPHHVRRGARLPEVGNAALAHLLIGEERRIADERGDEHLLAEARRLLALLGRHQRRRHGATPSARTWVARPSALRFGWLCGAAGWPLGSALGGAG
jgi:hypothetical protein